MNRSSQILQCNNPDALTKTEYGAIAKSPSGISGARFSDAGISMHQIATCCAQLLICGRSQSR